MDEIPWIENTVERFDETSFWELIDTDKAIQIARKEGLGIKDPSHRVNDFVDNLPSLFNWFGSNYRGFSWRRTQDPWAVIVAEILLQRTHAAKVDEIYDEFFDRFPTAEAVVGASRNELFETVEPLGFGNKKTKTLKTLAETMVEEHNGTVPNDIDILTGLPRIGPYTARACLCFGYGRPLAIVDSNVAIVMEHAIGYNSRQRAHKDRALLAFLDALIPENSDAARVFNLALLDLRVHICANMTKEHQCPLGAACLYTTRRTH